MPTHVRQAPQNSSTHNWWLLWTSLSRNSDFPRSCQIRLDSRPEYCQRKQCRLRRPYPWLSFIRRFSSRAPGRLRSCGPFRKDSAAFFTPCEHGLPSPFIVARFRGLWGIYLRKYWKQLTQNHERPQRQTQLSCCKMDEKNVLRRDTQSLPPCEQSPLSPSIVVRFGDLWRIFAANIQLSVRFSSSLRVRTVWSFVS